MPKINPVILLSSDEALIGRLKDFLKSRWKVELSAYPLTEKPDKSGIESPQLVMVDARRQKSAAVRVVKEISRDYPKAILGAIVPENDEDFTYKMYEAGISFTVPADAPDSFLPNLLGITFTQIKHQVKLVQARRASTKRESQLKEALQSLKKSQTLVEKRAQEQITVYRASRAMMSILDFDDLAREIVRLAAIEMRAEVGSLMLIEGENLVVRAKYGGEQEKTEILGMKQKVGEGIAGWVAKEGRPMLIKDIETHSMFKMRGGERYKTKSCVLSPIIVRRRVRGVINLTNKKGGEAFNEDDLRLLRTLAMTSSLALQNLELLEEKKRSDRVGEIGQLATQMAHEIRNPLQAIKMNIQILGKKYLQGTSDQEYYEILIGEISRLEQLIKDILDFAKPHELQLRDCDINQIVRHVCTVMAGLLEEKEITLVNDLDEEIPLVKGDADKLEQAFINLVNNAIEAMTSGGVLTISTKLTVPYVYPLSLYGLEVNIPIFEKHYEFVETTFNDTGCGIAAENLGKIFTPFFTTKAEGTGLGLSNTLKIVEQLEGKLTYSSELDKGATFKVILPVEQKSKQMEQDTLEVEEKVMDGLS